MCRSCCWACTSGPVGCVVADGCGCAAVRQGCQVRAAEAVDRVGDERQRERRAGEQLCGLPIEGVPDARVGLDPALIGELIDLRRADEVAESSGGRM